MAALYTVYQIRVRRKAAAALSGSRGEVERVKEKLANPHIPLHAAAVADHELAPEMTFEQPRTFAQRAVAWVGQVHNAWLFDRG